MTQLGDTADKDEAAELLWSSRVRNDALRASFSCAVCTSAWENVNVSINLSLSMNQPYDSGVSGFDCADHRTYTPS